jgi:hypothetical protein
MLTIRLWSNPLAVQWVACPSQGHFNIGQWKNYFVRRIATKAALAGLKFLDVGFDHPLGWNCH